MMNEIEELPILVLLVGIALFLAILTKAGMSRLGIPALVGYIGLGFLFRLINTQISFISPAVQEIFDFLAEIGIIALLFRVGLESDLQGLLRQLSKASKIWLGDVFFSGGIGFITAYFGLKLSLVPSLFIAIALTATSVGVSVGVWQEEKATDSENGQLMLDVAEMDDISGVILMALLFAVAPALDGGEKSSLISILTETSTIFLFKIFIFGAGCYFFSRYLEKGLTQFFRQIEPTPDPMLEVIGMGFIIAAISGILGFSVAIGAFFAGLLFSRDSETVKLEASVSSLYELFTPFFFLGIGLQIAPESLVTGFSMGLILLIAAVLGKVIGAGGSALLVTNFTGAVLIGMSMIPRAEIALIVMRKGLNLGDWAVPSHLFAATVVVATFTSIFTPIGLRHLLQKSS